MTNLSVLPHELLCLVADFLPFSEVVKWSSSSKFFRSCLAPRVCTTVAFGDDQISAAFALRAGHDHGSLVKKLVFSCGIRVDIHKGWEYPPMPKLLPADDEKDEEDNHGHKNRFLSAAAKSLLNGSQTPHASKLVVRTQLEDWSARHYDEFFEPIDDDVGGTLQAESKNGSRALMASVWDAVANNRNIRTLEVPALMPKFVSTFETPKFKCFLGGLHEIDLTVFSANREDRSAIGCMGYQLFLHRLGELFFDHAHNLRRLRLECAPDAPMGLGNNYYYYNNHEEDSNYIPLPLPKILVMPELHTLELSKCFICPELITFIGQHQASLRSLHLNCVASAGGHATMTWEVFFTQLVHLKTNLSRLIVDPWDPSYHDFYLPLLGLFFTYAFLTEGDASIFVDEAFAESNGRQARDRQAYLKLKMQMNANGGSSRLVRLGRQSREDDANDHSNDESDIGQHEDVFGDGDGTENEDEHSNEDETEGEETEVILAHQGTG